MCELENGQNANMEVQSSEASSEVENVQNADAEIKSSLSSSEMIVYNQFLRCRDSGEIIYKGEDAYPYIGNNILMIADGLGGTGASVHSKFDKNLFDEDKIVEALFGGIFDDIQDEQFISYIKKSFFELTSIKDYYFDSTKNMKHSAFFGSRLVCAILLQAIKQYPELFAGEALFEGYRQAENKQSFIAEKERFFASYIKENLIKIAKKVTLEHESEMAKKNFKLMATSLCALFYRELDNEVELFYLNSGDSRAYMWNAEGLHQMIEDQESADGGMTNFIYAEENAGFRIECEYRRVSKPCVIFNATDGCFDAFPFMISPLAFEKYILDIIQLNI